MSEFGTDQPASRGTFHETGRPPALYIGFAICVFICATVPVSADFGGEVVQVFRSRAPATTLCRQLAAKKDQRGTSIDSGAIGTQRSGSSALINGDFSAGLNGWAIEILGGANESGIIEIDASEQAVFLERHSFLISLYQRFVIPDRARELSFEVFFDPGFDLTDAFIPDAFEVQLLDDMMQSVVPTWDPLATSFFNAQEDVAQDPSGAINLAPGVTIEAIDGGGSPAWRVHVDLTGVAGGTVVTLFNDLIGADSDTASGVRVDNFILNTQPPISNPGGPYVGECNAGGVTIQLDGSASFDPDGNVIDFQWSTDCASAVISDPASPTPTLMLSGGVTDCSVTLTVSDGVFPPASASASVSMRDTTPPSIACPANLTLPATTVRGVSVADVPLAATAVDSCSAVMATDDRPADFFPPGDTTATFTVRDGAGLTGQCSTTVTVIAPEVPLIECLPALTLDVCPSDLVTPDEIGLAAPLVLGQPPLTVTDDRPTTVFPPGTTTVTFTVTDGNGDRATCSTTVTVSVLPAGSPGCPVSPLGSTLEIECPPAVQRRLCPNESADRRSIGLATPTILRASGVTDVSDDAPPEFPVGVTPVTFTVIDAAGSIATCVTDVLIELEDPGAAPCQDNPAIGDRFQERITTTTTETGVLACGSCGAIGLVPFSLTIVGIFGLRPAFRRRGGK